MEIDSTITNTFIADSSEITVIPISSFDIQESTFINDNINTINEERIFPLEEKLKIEVMEIYNNIGNKDKGTLEQFKEYLSEKGSNLKEEQKVYLTYYWIINNIVLDNEGIENNKVSFNPYDFFQKRKTNSTGYSLLFKELLISMNYSKYKIKNINGYSKSYNYSSLNPDKIFHEWNAVEIKNKWCLIDTTLDAQKTSEYYLCPPPNFL